MSSRTNTSVRLPLKIEEGFVPEVLPQYLMSVLNSHSEKILVNPPKIFLPSTCSNRQPPLCVALPEVSPLLS